VLLFIFNKELECVNGFCFFPFLSVSLKKWFIIWGARVQRWGLRLQGQNLECETYYAPQKFASFWAHLL
jgi:hypothetical protein